MPRFNENLIVKGTLTWALVNGDTDAVVIPQLAVGTGTALTRDITLLWRSRNITTMPTEARGIAVITFTFDHCNSTAIFNHIYFTNYKSENNYFQLMVPVVVL